MRNAHPISRRELRQTVAIIGAGTPAGSKLALLFARAGCRLLLSDGAPEAADRLRKDILAAEAAADVEVLPCERTSCWEADMIVIAMSISSRSRAIDRIRDVATGKIVVAAGSAAEGIAPLHARLPNARIVLFTGSGLVLSPGDDDARNTVSRLLDSGERTQRRRKVRAA